MTTSTGKVYQEYEKEIEKFFTQRAEQKAKEEKFVKRKREITGSIFLQALVWTVYKYGNIKLPQLVATAEELEPNCQVSEQAFQEKFSQSSVDFLQAMFVVAMQMSLPQSNMLVPLLNCFTAVYLLDSTSISLPSSMKNLFAGCGGCGSEAAAKIFLIMNWLTGKYETVEIKDGKKADQNMGKEFVSGKVAKALWIFDLGFWDFNFLSAIAQASSYFLSRLQSQVVIKVRNKLGNWVKFDLDEFLKVAPTSLSFEMQVQIGSKHKIESRLICSKVPTEVASIRRRKAREKARKSGRTPTKRLLARLDWSLFVTNAEPEVVPTSVIESVYRVRWQVELAFKVAKSDAGLDKTQSEKQHRVMTEFYAKLIALLFFERLVGLISANNQQFISRPKAWQRLRDKLKDWGRNLRSNEGLAQLIEIVHYIDRRAKPSKKLKYPSTFQRLQLAACNCDIYLLLDPLAFLALNDKSNQASVSNLFFHLPLTHRNQAAFQFKAA